MSTTCKDWRNLDWLKDARQLIAWIREQDRNHRLIVVIRHSHREDSYDPQELSKKRLTSLGHQMAFCFGKELPSNLKVEISSSGHPRCHETAQDIIDGYMEVVGNARLSSNIQIAVAAKGSGDKISHKMLRLGSAEFIRQWVDGKLPANTIIPFEEFGNTFVKEILECLKKSSNNTLSIHVTHDLQIMALRNFLFNTTPCNENWTSYLGGFGLVQIYGFEREIELALDDTFSTGEVGKTESV